MHQETDIAVFSEVRMRFRRAILTAACFVVCTSFGFSQTADQSPLSVRPVDRLMQNIDDTQLVTLGGSRHPLAKPQYARGPVLEDQSMSRMVLVLRADPSQDAALQELLRAQQDPVSPYYHQWLTPQAFGQRFGASQKDLSRIVFWLESHGMQVDEVPASRRSIVFSGSAGQVQSAFHTSIQKYSVQGESHFANATDVQIPQALAPVIHGVVSLHDFRSASQIVAPAPNYTAANGVHFLAPQDWDVIYDVNPLFRQGLDGTGQSIAVLGRVDVALSDVRAFRSKTGLPANDPLMIVNGPDPGFPNCSDEAESALDVEWAGAIAKNATVKFVTSKSGATDGINLSAQYAVNNNVAPIVTLSYGLCEAAYSAAGNAFWNSLWQQAAAQGMSVFVSSGDSGAAGCDSMNVPTATHGRGVNALCSSPYSTCVGGTLFNDVYNSAQYWSATNGTDQSSVLSYIPEVAWNESGWSNALFASSGGVSSVYSKPAWQSAPGVPSDGMRDVPDVAMSAAIHDAYLIQIQGGIFYVAGTSAATPSLASVMALVLENTGARQGNANPTLYSLATSQLTSSAANIFHDVTSGNNSVPGVTGFNTGIGYDLVTGLGSVDASLLVNHWADRASANFGLSASPTSVSMAAGTVRAFAVTESVQNGFTSPVIFSAGGIPAGVTLTFSPSMLTAPGSATLTIATLSTTVPGTYTVTITGTAAGLTRTTPVTIIVTAAPSFTLQSNAATLSVTAGSAAALTLTTASVSGFKSAITLSVSGLPKGVTAAFSPATIASPGNGSSTLKFTAATSVVAGTCNLTVSAAGAGVSKTLPVTLTVTVPAFTLSAAATSASVRPSAPARISFTTAVSGGFKSAITLAASGQPKGLTATFSPASIASPGNGSSTLTVASTTTATTGTYTLTITATGGGLTRTQKLAITLTH
jgi:pseudomonalisin